jgi:TetR/AcrR family transcriptional repressor of nem operon
VVGRPKEFVREEVLATAMDVFWANGYEATSLDDLTRAMRIGRGSLYNEFGDKHTLFIEALDRYRFERFAQLEAVLEASPSARAGIAAVFRRTMDRLWGDGSKRGCLMVNSAAELAGSDPAVAERARQSFDRFAQAFRSSLERGQRDGELDPSLDVRTTASYLAGAFIGLRLLAKITDRGTADEFVEVTLKALQ